MLTSKVWICPNSVASAGPHLEPNMSRLLRDPRVSSANYEATIVFVISISCLRSRIKAKTIIGMMADETSQFGLARGCRGVQPSCANVFPCLLCAARISITAISSLRTSTSSYLSASIASILPLCIHCKHLTSCTNSLTIH